MDIYDLRFDPYVEPSSTKPSVNLSVLLRPCYHCRKLDSSDSQSPIPGEQSTFLHAVYGTVGPAIVTFGLIGNLIILLVVGRSSMSGNMTVPDLILTPGQRNTPSTLALGAIPVYLSALALSDIGALLSSIPLWIRLSEQVSCSYWNAFYYGHLELFVLNTFMAASIFNVVALTLERYAIVFLFSLQRT